jgi:hypothetical protein
MLKVHGVLNESDFALGGRTQTTTRQTLALSATARKAQLLHIFRVHVVLPAVPGDHPSEQQRCQKVRKQVEHWAPLPRSTDSPLDALKMR